MKPVRSLALLAIVPVLASCASQSPPAASPASVANTPVAKYAGLSAPASVLYDPSSDRYLVANTAGEPLAHDNNGFISVLSPDGHVANLKWIAGGQGNVKLDAPKGLAIAGGVLYVADIDVVRRFDAETGVQQADIAVPGSTSLTDLSVAPDGKIYLSDAGPPTGRLDGRGTEAIYVIDGDRAKSVATGSALGRPDAIAWTDAGLVVGPFGAAEIYRLDAQGQKQDVTKLPAGGLSGIVTVGDSLLVTSWQSSSVYRGKLGGTFEVALADQTTPADIGYDTKRARLLVPSFSEDTVEAFELR